MMNHLLLLCVLACPANDAASGSIDPFGVSGSLVICGGGSLPDVILDRFVELAGGEKARLVVIPTASGRANTEADESFCDAWQDWGLAEVTVLHTRSREEANDPRFVAPLKSATAVWIGGGAQSRLAEAYVGTAVERELNALLNRDGVIGGSSAGAAIQSRLMIARGNPVPEIGIGFDLLPGAVIDQHFLKRNRKPRLLKALNDHREHVGFGIDEGTAMVVQGRQIEVLGDSTVTVCLAASQNQPARVFELKPGQTEDLTTLRRAARTRSQSAPPAAPSQYSDGRPTATLRMDAKDHGVVLRHGDGPDECDILGARDVWVFEADGTYYMHYDAAGPRGWLCSLAVSTDLLNWEKKGPILDFGEPGEDDAKCACYGLPYHDGNQWHLFYLGTPNATPPPDRVPSLPYLTMKAKGNGPAGPWTKQKDIIPFRTKPDTYYSMTASPGHIVQSGDEYLQFFSSTTTKPGNPCIQRTLGIARTKDLDGTWTVDPQPLVPIEEQIENSSLYYEQANQTWFLFTNHIGIDKVEYTDAVWVYWSRDLNRWDPKNKAVVLDGRNCTWSKKCVGLPSVVPHGKRLALFYDAPGGESTSHMKRDIGLAWLELPLAVPK